MRKVLSPLGLSVCAWLYLEWLRFAADEPFGWAGTLARFGFVGGVLLAAWVSRPRYGASGWRFPWPGLLLGAAGMASIAWYVETASTVAAWLTAGTIYVVALWLASLLTSNLGAGIRGQGAGTLWDQNAGSRQQTQSTPLLTAVDRGRVAARRRVYAAMPVVMARLRCLATRSILALVAGLALVAIVQVESHFAEEEFFAAIQVVALLPFGWLLLSAFNLCPPFDLHWFSTPGMPVNRSQVVLAFVLCATLGIGAVVQAYQRSAFPNEAPGFPGIGTERPFLCGTIAPGEQTYDGRDIFPRLLSRVERTEPKGASEYALLAIGTGETRWANVFRAQLLAEAAQGLYTGPAGSVKSGQRAAALRVYFYPRVRAAFPGLFSDEDDRAIRAWFGAINRRALTVEWVDWMYALAFSVWPEGPYQNQESGAGLLAVLEHEGFAPPDLSPRNRDYLARYRRGWEWIFRNNDDALIYQPEWFGNAYLQAEYTGVTNTRNLRRSAEWLLLQTLPDGGLLGYNHPYPPTVAETAYLAARLLDDPRSLWFAGRLVEGLEAADYGLYTQPGMEQPVDRGSTAPTEGSCLLYGDSGLPNQLGPLAPDKLVFRDGWERNSTYLLLNLRFTGWHRYKATNTVTLVYRGAPLAGDNVERQVFTWLPAGRSLLRDKRIPRENLNGLLVERSGMSAVLHRLAEIDSRWAQDPPYYARVERFETGKALDVSGTVLEGWRGWQHHRTIFFHHQGPVVLLDEADGPADGQAALAWSAAAEFDRTGLGAGPREGSWRIPLGGAGPSELLLLPIGAAGTVDVSGQGTGRYTQIMYNAPVGGQLRLVSVFLTGVWAGAQAEIVAENGSTVLRITQGTRRIRLVLGDE